MTDDSVAEADHDARFRPLGYHEQAYYFIGGRTEQMQVYGAEQLLKKAALIELAGVDFWAEKYTNAKKIDWEAEGAQLIKICQDIRHFQPSDIRGIGAWRDGKSIVIHLGDCVLVDGVPVAPSKVKSRYVYPRRSPLLDCYRPNGPTFRRMADALSDAEGGRILDVLRHLRWNRPFYGDLLAGWIATATVCGALSWRTHCWLNGPQGSGKSFTIDAVIGAILGDQALMVRGDSSRAGIEQTLQLDARPVVYDEAEARNERARQRREAIIELMREASHEGAAKSLKGSATHRAHQFQVRSQFLLASIGVGLKEAADEMRCVVLTLRGAETETEEDRLANQAHFDKLKAMLRELPAMLPERLFLRMAGLVDTLRVNIATFAGVIAETLPGGQRFGDRLGCLLAGAYALRSSEILSAEEARHLIEEWEINGDLSEFGVSTMTEREHSEVVQYLMQAVVRCTTDNKSSVDRTIGELVSIALGETKDDVIMAFAAEDQLKRYGIRVGPKEQKIYIAENPTNRNLDQIMRGSPYATGYQRILLQAPGAMRPRTTMRFAGTQARVVALPASVAFKAIADNQEEMFNGSDQREPVSAIENGIPD